MRDVGKCGKFRLGTSQATEARLGRPSARTTRDERALHPKGLRKSFSNFEIFFFRIFVRYAAGGMRGNGKRGKLRLGSS